MIILIVIIKTSLSFIIAIFLKVSIVIVVFEHGTHLKEILSSVASIFL